MSLRVTLLGSGSSGNSTLISDGDAHILVDIGLSGKETARRLREFGVEPRSISAVVISHEHGDHCRGVVPFVKSLDVPVFITDRTYEASTMNLDPRKRQRIESGKSFELNSVVFTPFSVPHDAADPVGFRIERAGASVAIVLDLGYLSNLVVERLRGCDGIILESNHDVNMLKVGPYPWALKQRVMSRRGHLSNDAVAEYLVTHFDGAARYMVLAHLSKMNNLPELAILSARRALESRSSLAATQTRLELAEPDRISRTLQF